MAKAKRIPEASENTEQTAGSAPRDVPQGAAAALLNGLRVLEAFSSSTPELGVTEVANQVGLHKSTVSRILAGLAEAGYVQKVPAGTKYRLGLGLIALAGPLLAELDVRHLARDDLQAAAAATGETSALSLFNGTEVVVVDQVACPQYVKHTQYIGTRYDRWASSSMRVALAFAAPEAVATLLAAGTVRDAPAGEADSAVGTSGASGADIPVPAEVQAEFASIREHGWAVNDGATDAQEFGISAPIFDHDGQLAAVLTLSAPRARVDAALRQRMESAVRDYAGAVSGRLGWRGGIPAQ